MWQISSRVYQNIWHLRRRMIKGAKLRHIRQYHGILIEFLHQGHRILNTYVGRWFLAANGYDNVDTIGHNLWAENNSQFVMGDSYPGMLVRAGTQFADTVFNTWQNRKGAADVWSGLISRVARISIITWQKNVASWCAAVSRSMSLSSSLSSTALIYATPQQYPPQQR